MRKILKRSMAWLLIVAMFVGLIPYAAFANDGDKDVSKQFKITEFSVKLNNNSEPAYELGESEPTINEEKHYLSPNMNVPLVINLSFEPKDDQSAQDLKPGDYMIFDLFSVETTYADKIDPLTIASDKLDFGTAEIIKSEQDDRTLFQVKVTLTEAIDTHKDLRGILAPNGRVNGLDAGKTMTLQKDGQTFATINGRDPSTFNFYQAPLQVTSKNYSWHWGDETPARIQWDLKFEQEIPTQFEDCLDAKNGKITSSITDDMILVETLDKHQTFGDEPKLNFEYHAYLYDAERTADQKNADKANKLVYPYLDHDQNGTVYPDVESNLTLDDLNFTEQQDEKSVRENPKSWAIVTDENGCEKLIINFGTPGSTGLKYSDIFNEDQHEQLLAGFDAELKHIDEMIVKAGDNPNDMTHISDSITGQDMTIADWKKFEKIYKDSKTYYQKLDDKYVYGFTAKLQTYVKFNKETHSYDRDTLLTEKVVNKYQMEGLTEEALFASCDNFWRNAMVAVAKPGDVVLFKADSREEIDVDDLDKDTMLEQPVEGAEFQVYAKDGETPLTFTKGSDGRYALDTDSTMTDLPTDEYGQLIVTGLTNDGEYYFKEVKAPAGYVLNEKTIAFTISNTEIRYVLAKNDPKATYTVTYEYEGTVPEGAPVLPDESTYYQGDKIIVADEPKLEGYTFTGWTVKTPDGVDITDGSFTMPEGNVVLVGTWQRNIEGTVTVTPADITIYMGGNDGYEAVVGGEDNTALTTNNSLPEPLFYIEGPEGATLNVTDLAFSDGGSKGWKATEAGKDAEGKTLYRLEATAEDQLPVRVQYINADGEAVISDVFEPSAELFATYDIKMYYGENKPESIKAIADGKTYDVKADAVGTLTVRAVDDTNNSAADNPVHLISETLPSERLSAGTAAVTPKEENTTYTLNNTTVPVKNPAAVGLLFDTIIDDDGHDRSGALKDKVDSEMGNASYGTTRHYQSRYLDLVDEDNGNAWVKASGPVTVTWAYPEDTGKNTDFTLYHFEGLHRDDSTGGQSGFELDDLKAVDPEKVTITKTDAGIQFEVGSGGFSPFVLVWEEDDPYYPPYDPGDDDEEEPDTPALDKVNHFLYVEGYPEDYRTGEYSDNEDLWPVKPQGNITRAEVATIFYRLLKDEVREEIEADVNSFPDVNEDDWFNITVSSLANMGALSGYEDGTFRPNEPISRAELAAMAVRFYDAFEAEYEEGTFLDVDGDEWYADAIAAAEELGIIGGYPDGTVRPNNNITRAETCAIVNRVLERRPHDEHLGDVDDMRTWPDNQPGAWYYADMQEATNGHYYEWIDIDGSKFEEWTEVDKDYDWTKR